MEDSEGKYFLWYDAPSMQYLERPGDRVIQYFKVAGSPGLYADLPPDF